MLRPGILDMFQSISQGQRQGRIGPVVIYSNNSALEVLEFVRDVLHEAIGAPTIEVCAHWGHPLRINEIVPNDPGNARKTWDVLHALFAECGAYDATPSNTLFFDDQPHPDLMKNLGENYIHVTGYSYRIPKYVRNTLFVNALESLQKSDKNSLNPDLLTINSTSTHLPPRNNTSIEFMKQSLIRLLSNTQNTQNTQTGGKRKSGKTCRRNGRLSYRKTPR